MDFNLSSDQQFFRETIRSFVDKEIRPVASELEKSGTYPTEIVEKMKSMGLFGLLIPEEYGGQDIDFVSMAILFEELSIEEKINLMKNVDALIGSHSSGLTNMLFMKSETKVIDIRDPNDKIKNAFLNLR